MVSIGTVLTLGIIGAVGIGAYSLYRNADKLGGALSRGVEETIVSPLGDWADSLWSAIANPFGIGESTPLATPPESSSSYAEYVTGVDNRTQKEIDDWYTTNKIPNPNEVYPSPDTTTQYDTIPEPTPLPQLQPPRESYPSPTPPEAFGKFTGSQAGYYYFDVAGSEWDTQQYLSLDEVNKLKNADNLFYPGGLENIKYIGKSSLQQAGFTLFGKSQGYL